MASGDASIGAPSGGSMIVTQRSDRAVLDWTSFGIAPGHSVHFDQPGRSSAVLNRVTGSADSRIHGSLTGTGQVHLVNPNGIFIGRDGKVSTGGGFVASTLDVSTEDFQAGRLRYRGNGASGRVVNRGAIEVGRGGYAALLGGHVSNAGTVSVPLGRIGFASGERVTLDLSGDGFLQVAVPTNAESADGEALIENSGTARADGGRVEMTAATARHAARHAINLSGTAEATSVAMRGGTLILGGGPGGTVTVSGRASASARPAPRATVDVHTSLRPVARPAGGRIDITGARIALDGAELDASGAGGGGRIRVGGDFAGAGPLPRARSVTSDAATTIRADAGAAGDGGDIAVWSDDDTTFSSTVSARGGAGGGNGGFVEVSSANRLSYSGRTDTRAPKGARGMLLLDPIDITVDPGAGPNNEDEIEANLVTTDVTLDTFDNCFSDAGDITINADIDWNTDSTLTLDADGDVLLNGAINGPAGELVIIGDNAVLPAAAADIDVDRFELSSGDWTQVGPGIADFAANNFALGSGSTFLRATGGTGSLADPYVVTDLFGLQGVGSGSLDTASFRLGADIDAGPAATWNGGSGFSPIGQFLSGFEGSFDGALNTISNLTIDNEFESDGVFYSPAGLFATISDSGIVENLFLEDVSILGSVAGAVAADNDGTVRAVSVTGSVTGTEDAGGIVGFNGGVLEQSTSSAAVDLSLDPSSEFSGVAGGAAGANGGTISQVSAFGDVTGSDPGATGNLLILGGLVGQNNVSVEDSYAQGDVTATSEDDVTSATVGGLVGLNDGVVTSSYSSGAPSGTGPFSDLFVGGLVGDSGEGTAPSSYWDPTSSGVATSAGGTGVPTADLQDTLANLSELGGFDFDTIWAPGDDGVYPRLYSVDPVVFAEPDPLSLTYGQTDGAVATGSVAGGPGDYVFDDPDNTLDTDPIFAAPVLADTDAGTTTFALDETPLPSALGPDFDVVSLDGDADIDPADLLITPLAQDKQYGTELDDDPALVETEGLVAGDSVTVIDFLSDGVAPDADVSVYSLTADNATGPGLENYVISYGSSTLEVTPAPLTITANDQTKTYGDPFEFSGNEFTNPALLFSDEFVASVELTSDATAADADVAGSPYPIAIGGASGPGLENYDITYVDGAFTVDPLPLTVFANDAEKVYGETVTFDGSEFTLSFDPLFDDSIDSVTLSSDGAAADAGVAGSPYAIVASEASGSGVGNYDLTFVDGALDVTPAPLTITANDGTKVYGAFDIFDGSEFSAEGLVVEGDSVDRVVLSSDGAAQDASVAGSPYTILALDAEGSGLENYDITFVDGSLTVTPAPLTITANDLSKVYGQGVTFDGSGFTVDGLVLESDRVDSVSLASAGAAAGAGVAGSPYTIVVSDPAGAGLANYTVTLVNGNLTVTPAPLTITANDLTKVFGQTIVFDGTEFTVEGLVVEGDRVDSVLLASLGAAADADPGDSPFAIVARDAEGAGLSNYDITFVDGVLTVEPDENPTEVASPILPPPPTLPTLPSIPVTFDTSFDGPVTAGLIGAGGIVAAPAVADAAETLGAVDAISAALSTEAAACSTSDVDVSRYLACLSDALTAFAGELDDISSDLPPGLENVATIVQDASRSIDASRARAAQRLASATSDAEREAIRSEAIAEAQGAIATASDEIRKAIALVRVEDPELANLQRATITRVADAVDTVGIELSRAVGL